MVCFSVLSRIHVFGITRYYDKILTGYEECNIITNKFEIYEKNIQPINMLVHDSIIILLYNPRLV